MRAIDDLGPIGNKYLFESDKCTLKPDLAHQKDYLAINNFMWKYLHGKFGGGPSICRSSIDIYGAPVATDGLSSEMMPPFECLKASDASIFTKRLIVRSHISASRHASHPPHSSPKRNLSPHPRVLNASAMYRRVSPSDAHTFSSATAQAVELPQKQQEEQATECTYTPHCHNSSATASHPYHQRTHEGHASPSGVSIVSFTTQTDAMAPERSKTLELSLERHSPSPLVPPVPSSHRKDRCGKKYPSEKSVPTHAHAVRTQRHPCVSSRTLPPSREGMGLEGLTLADERIYFKEVEETHWDLYQHFTPALLGCSQADFPLQRTMDVDATLCSTMETVPVGLPCASSDTHCASFSSLLLALPAPLPLGKKHRQYPTSLLHETTTMTPFWPSSTVKLLPLIPSEDAQPETLPSDKPLSPPAEKEAKHHIKPAVVNPQEKKRNGRLSISLRKFRSLFSFRTRCPAGLTNLENSCFMNAALQCLTAIPQFPEKLCFAMDERDCTPLLGEIRSLILKLSKIPPSQPFFTPLELRLRLKEIVPALFHDGIQQDSHEFLRILIDYMQERLKPHRPVKKFHTSATHAVEPPNDDFIFDTDQSWQSYLFYNFSVMAEFFAGQLCSRVKCLSCSTCNDTFDPIWDISISLASKTSHLIDCFNQFFNSEHVDYCCKICKKQTIAERQFFLMRPPRILLIQLKRFSADGSKLPYRVDFPINDLIIPNCNTNVAYVLIGVVQHRGKSGKAGHYISFVRRKRKSSTTWFKCDDEKVVLVDEMEVRNMLGRSNESTKTCEVLIHA
ncbi:putative Ubiquitin carboxyl-terminal hydrolase 3 [Cardiosporidium cionae]|uniref:ubiquitinyl hydrolase 1 n=1 Tax=Cardiosporidium cionae TaxID=476202 RepID=A0ABQ7JB90_9APIC|nr:putative Ubiquitin carboxyl-terminal hydrolase 3 [Cardiosporidium cionae]|eukprot:KAF8821236.1 putative Ubiquitin carboxyl-terminal hydrolase 3 [Cardiosporidium cionae]